jgi:hypothetical protein
LKFGMPPDCATRMQRITRWMRMQYRWSCLFAVSRQFKPCRRDAYASLREDIDHEKRAGTSRLRCTGPVLRSAVAAPL